jgi:hypothetical protein
VRVALWVGHERKRLYHEAVSYMRTRAARGKYAQHAE